MNDFARLHSGDPLFKRVMVSVTVLGVAFAAYVSF